MPVPDRRVDVYIDRLPDWQAELCRYLRDLIHTAGPEIEETIKRSVQPYFVLDGNVCALLATKDHINMFIYDPHVADPDEIINEGDGNATAKTLQIYEGDAVNERALLTMLRAVISRNRAGGWRHLDDR